MLQFRKIDLPNLEPGMVVHFPDANPRDYNKYRIVMCVHRFRADFLYLCADRNGLAVVNLGAYHDAVNDFGWLPHPYPYHPDSVIEICVNPHLITGRHRVHTWGEDRIDAEF